MEIRQQAVDDAEPVAGADEQGGLGGPRDERPLRRRGLQRPQRRGAHGEDAAAASASRPAAGVVGSSIWRAAHRLAAMGEHTERSTLAACVASIVGVPASEVPLGEIDLRAWLSGRGLGLVPIDAAQQFEWAGPWIAWRPQVDGGGRAAVVMFGTNDIGWFADDHVKTLRWYSAAMFDLVDKLMGAGVVPILSTIPPRDDNPSHDDWVSLFNGVIRGMAQGRQVPLVDYHRELMPLSSHGLSGDGVHPNAMSGNACVLTDTGLAYGYNVRNAITLQALDRIRRSVFDSETAPDEAVELGGQGTITAPFVITDTVFADVRSTLQATNHGLDVYDCSAANESGPEFVYRLEVQETKRLRAVVLTRGDVDVDLHLLGKSAVSYTTLTLSTTYSL